MLINSPNLQKLRKGYQTVFQNAFNAAPSFWDKVAMKVTSTTGSEVYGWLGSSTKFREWIGDRVIQNLAEHDYEIKNKKWEDTIGVSADKIRDDNLGTYAPMFQALGQDAKQHPDILTFGLLQTGFTALCYDGQYFFDTDHPVGPMNNPASVSNFLTGSNNPWYLMDLTRPIKPLIYQEREPYQFTALDNPDDPNVFTKDEFLYGARGRSNVGFGLWQLAFASKTALDAANYDALKTAMLSQKNDAGNPLALGRLTLVCGPSNETAARTLLTAKDNAAGATNVYNGTADLLVVPYLP